MGKPRQKYTKYLKTGDLVEAMETVHGTIPGTSEHIWFEERYPAIKGDIGLILSASPRTKPNFRTECVVLFGEKLLRFQGDYWLWFVKIS